MTLIVYSGAMRLVEGIEHGEGRLEIYNEMTGEWGEVCADQMTPHIADLACQQIGFPGAHAGKHARIPTSVGSLIVDNFFNDPRMSMVIGILLRPTVWYTWIKQHQHRFVLGWVTVLSISVDSLSNETLN